MRVFYTIGVCLYSLGVRVAAIFGNAKARLWVEGREAKALEPVERPNEQWIWFHAASLGEFEQGRPVIEAIKQTHPEFKILLSFFSPSGYEVRKNYPLADEVLYLPADTPSHAKAWVQRHHFVAAFFIKYEFWFNYMRALEEANIPLFYIALILKPDSYFFHWYGSWFRKQLKTVDHFFVQDQATAESLKQHGMDNVTVCGDTRLDRVLQIKAQAKQFPAIAQMVDGCKNVLVMGSSWEPDEDIVLPYFNSHPEVKMIIAPHEFDEHRLQAMMSRITRPVARYTQLEGKDPSMLDCIIIDCFGLLSSLYRYGTVAYVGGGFGSGIHNVPEAAVYGIPVLFGPRHEKFREAVELNACGGAFAINDAQQCTAVLDKLLSNDDALKTAGNAASHYITTHTGATRRIFNDLFNDL